MSLIVRQVVIPPPTSRGSFSFASPWWMFLGTEGARAPWSQKDMMEIVSGWWFGTFLYMFEHFPYIGNSNPNWLIFFRGIETTNQVLLIGVLKQTKMGDCWPNFVTTRLILITIRIGLNSGAKFYSPHVGGTELSTFRSQNAHFVFTCSRILLNSCWKPPNGCFHCNTWRLLDGNVGIAISETIPHSSPF